MRSVIHGVFAGVLLTSIATTSRAEQVVPVSMADKVIVCVTLGRDIKESMEQVTALKTLRNLMRENVRSQRELNDEREAIADSLRYIRDEYSLLASVVSVYKDLGCEAELLIGPLAKGITQ